MPHRILMQYQTVFPDDSPKRAKMRHSALAGLC